MIAAVMVTLVVTVMIVRTASTRAQLPEIDFTREAEAAPPELGVQGKLVSGNVSLERRWKSLEISAAMGESVDPDLPPGPFEGEFTIEFRPGQNRWARIGVEIQGGSIIIIRDGEVVHSDYAGPERKVVLTKQPIWLPHRVEVLKYMYKSKAGEAVFLRALWQPIDADEPRPLP